MLIKALEIAIKGLQAINKQLKTITNPLEPRT